MKVLRDLCSPLLITASGSRLEATLAATSTSKYTVGGRFPSPEEITVLTVSSFYCPDVTIQKEKF